MYSGLVRILAFLFLAIGSSSAEAQTGEHSTGLQHMRAGDFQSAVRALGPVAATGCKPLTLYLLGAAHSQLYEAAPTIRAISRALDCRAPALPSEFRGPSNELLRWAVRWLRGRRERLRFEFSAADEVTSDVLRLIAEKQRDEAEEREIAGLLALADDHLPEEAVLLTQAETIQSLECRMSSFLREGCERRDDPPVVELPPD